MFDTIVDEHITQVQVEAEFGTETAECHAQIVRLFRIQVGITIADGGRITGIPERIQVPDTRTVDTHVIICTQRHGVTQHIRNVGRRYDVIKICIEVPVR